MGDFTEHGLGGLTQDPAKALDYYRRAAEGGSQEAKEALERLGGGGAAPAAPAEAPAPEEPAEETPKEKGKGGFFKKFFG